MRISTWIGIAILCGWLYTAQAQFEPVTIDLGMEVDLPDNTFYDVLLDHQNYYWMATNEGLYRYDGSQFERISTAQKQGKAVFGLQLDPTGDVWCNNIYGQFLRYHADTLQVFIDLKKQLGGELATFYRRKDHLLVFSSKGVIQVGISDKRVTVLDTVPILNAIQHGAHLYAITSQGQLLRHRTATDGTTKLQTIAPQLLRPQEIFKPVMAADAQHLFLLLQSNQHQLLRIDHSNFHPTVIQLPAALQVPINRIQCIDDQLWITTTRGLFRCVIVGSDLHIVQRWLPAFNVSAVVKDPTHGYLIATLQKGLWLAPNAEVLTLKQPPENITQVARIGENDLAIANTNGEVHLYHNLLYRQTLYLPNASSVSHLYYHAPDRALYASTNNRLTYRIEWPSLRMTSITEKLAIAKDLEPLDDHRLIYLNFKESKVVDLRHLEAEVPPFDESRPFKALHLPAIRCTYLIGIEGLKVFGADFQPLHVQGFGQPKGTLNDLIRINERALWVVYDQALYRIENNQLVDSLHLPQFSNIRRGYSDGQQSLWLSTHEGIVHINLATQQVQRLNKEDGIPTQTMEMLPYGAHLLLYDAYHCYLVPRNDPGLFREYPIPTPLIRSVQIDQIPYALDGSPIRVSHRQREIKIELGANALLAQQRYRYRYRINGAPQWSTLAQGSQELLLNSLSKGRYLLEVQVVNSHGVASRSTIQLAVVVLPPFWRTTGFVVLLGLSFVLFAFGGLRVILYRATQRRNAEMQRLILDKRLVNLQLENLRSQMNPHFIFNALNSVQDYIISNERQLASRFLVKFSKLIRIYLEHGQRSYISLKQEVEALELYLALEKVRFDGALDYTIELAPELDVGHIAVPSLMMQPYVENALKHGLMHRRHDRRLRIVFSYSADGSALLCRITDNGIGRQAAQALRHQKNPAHQSFATQATDTRVELLNASRSPQEGHIKVETIDLTHPDGSAAGTTVRITIPIKPSSI